MRWSCLQFNVLLLPESYRRLPAETRWKPLFPPPTRPGRNVENNTHNTQSRPYSVHMAPMRFSGSSLILSCLPVSFSCGIVYSRAKRTPESEKNEDVRISHQTENQRGNVGIRTRYLPGTSIPSCVLAPEGGVNSNPSSREVILEDGIYPLLF